MSESHPTHSKWVCQPWFDEGEHWPEEPGTPDIIEAGTREEAFEKARASFNDRYTALADIHVMSPDEWFGNGGYPVEGLDRG
jgi:hypothetical protein